MGICVLNDNINGILTEVSKLSGTDVSLQVSNNLSDVVFSMFNPFTTANHVKNGSIKDLYILDMVKLKTDANDVSRKLYNAIVVILNEEQRRLLNDIRYIIIDKNRINDLYNSMYNETTNILFYVPAIRFEYLKDRAEAYGRITRFLDYGISYVGSVEKEIKKTKDGKETIVLTVKDSNIITNRDGKPLTDIAEGKPVNVFFDDIELDENNHNPNYIFRKADKTSIYFDENGNIVIEDVSGVLSNIKNHLVFKFDETPDGLNIYLLTPTLPIDSIISNDTFVSDNDLRSLLYDIEYIKKSYSNNIYDILNFKNIKGVSAIKNKGSILSYTDNLYNIIKGRNIKTMDVEKVEYKEPILSIESVDDKEDVYVRLVFSKFLLKYIFDQMLISLPFYVDENKINIIDVSLRSIINRIDDDVTRIYSNTRNHNMLIEEYNNNRKYINEFLDLLNSIGINRSFVEVLIEQNIDLLNPSGLKTSIEKYVEKLYDVVSENRNLLISYSSKIVNMAYDYMRSVVDKEVDIGDDEDIIDAAGIEGEPDSIGGDSFERNDISFLSNDIYLNTLAYIISPSPYSLTGQLYAFYRNMMFNKDIERKDLLRYLYDEVVVNKSSLLDTTSELGTFIRISSINIDNVLSYNNRSSMLLHGALSFYNTLMITEPSQYTILSYDEYNNGYEYSSNTNIIFMKFSREQIVSFVKSVMLLYTGMSYEKQRLEDYKKERDENKRKEIYSRIKDIRSQNIKTYSDVVRACRTNENERTDMFLYYSQYVGNFDTIYSKLEQTMPDIYMLVDVFRYGDIKLIDYNKLMNFVLNPTNIENEGKGLDYEVIYVRQSHKKFMTYDGNNRRPRPVFASFSYINNRKYRMLHSDKSNKSISNVYEKVQTLLYPAFKRMAADINVEDTNERMNKYKSYGLYNIYSILEDMRSNYSKDLFESFIANYLYANSGVLAIYSGKTKKKYGINSRLYKSGRKSKYRHLYDTIEKYYDIRESEGTASAKYDSDIPVGVPTEGIYKYVITDDKGNEKNPYWFYILLPNSEANNEYYNDVLSISLSNINVTEEEDSNEDISDKDVISKVSTTMKTTSISSIMRFFNNISNINSAVIYVGTMQPIFTMVSAARIRAESISSPSNPSNIYNPTLYNVLSDPEKEISFVTPKGINRTKLENTTINLAVQCSNFITYGGGISTQTAAGGNTLLLAKISYKGINSKDININILSPFNIFEHKYVGHHLAGEGLSSFMYFMSSEKVTTGYLHEFFNNNIVDTRFVDDRDINNWFFGSADTSNRSIGGLLAQMSVKDKIKIDLYYYVIGNMFNHIMKGDYNKDNIDFVVGSIIKNIASLIERKQYSEIFKSSNIDIVDSDTFNNYILPFGEILTHIVAYKLLNKNNIKTIKDVKEYLKEKFDTNPEEANKMLFELFSGSNFSEYSHTISLFYDIITNNYSVEEIKVILDRINEGEDIENVIHSILDKHIKNIISNIKNNVINSTINYKLDNSIKNISFLDFFNRANEVMLGPNMVRIEYDSDENELHLYIKNDSKHYSISLDYTSENIIEAMSFLSSYEDFTRALYVNSKGISSYMSFINYESIGEKDIDELHSDNFLIASVPISDSNGNYTFYIANRKKLMSAYFRFIASFARNFSSYDLNKIRDKEWQKENIVRKEDIADYINNSTGKEYVFIGSVEQAKGPESSKRLVLGNTVAVFNSVYHIGIPDNIFSKAFTTLANINILNKENFDSLFIDYYNKYISSFVNQYNTNFKDSYPDSVLDDVLKYTPLTNKKIINNNIKAHNSSLMITSHTNELFRALIYYGNKKNEKSRGLLFFSGRDVNVFNNKIYEGKESIIKTETSYDENGNAVQSKTKVHNDIVLLSMLIDQLYKHTYDTLINESVSVKYKDGGKRNKQNTGISVVKDVIEVLQDLYNVPGGFRITDGKIRTSVYNEIVLDDIKTNNNILNDFISHIKELSEGEFMNGFAFMPLEVYRLLAIPMSEWDSEKEEIYHKIINGNITDKDIGVLLKTIGGDKARIGQFKPHNGAQISNGIIQMTNQEKFAVLPFHPNMLSGSVISDSEQILVSLYNYMKNNNIHILTFESGSKMDKMLNYNSNKNSIIAIDDKTNTVKIISDDINKSIKTGVAIDRHKININETDIRYFKLVTPASKMIKDKTYINTKFMIFSWVLKMSNVEKINRLDNSINDTSRLLIERISELGGKTVSEYMIDFLISTGMKADDAKNIVNANIENYQKYVLALIDVLSEKKDNIIKKITKLLGVSQYKEDVSDRGIVYGIVSTIFEGNKEMINLSMNLFDAGLSPLLVGSLSEFNSLMKKTEDMRKVNGYMNALVPIIDNTFVINGIDMELEDINKEKVLANSINNGINIEKHGVSIRYKNDILNRNTIVVGNKKYNIKSKTPLSDNTIKELYDKIKDNVIKTYGNEDIIKKSSIIISQKTSISEEIIEGVLKDEISISSDETPYVVELEKRDGDNSLFAQPDARYYIWDILDDSKNIDEDKLKTLLSKHKTILIYDIDGAILMYSMYTIVDGEYKNVLFTDNKKAINKYIKNKKHIDINKIDIVYMASNTIYNTELVEKDRMNYILPDNVSYGRYDKSKYPLLYDDGVCVVNNLSPYNSSITFNSYALSRFTINKIRGTNNNLFKVLDFHLVGDNNNIISDERIEEGLLISRVSKLYNDIMSIAIEFSDKNKHKERTIIDETGKVEKISFEEYLDESVTSILDSYFSEIKVHYDDKTVIHKYTGEDVKDKYKKIIIDFLYNIQDIGEDFINNIEKYIMSAISTDDKMTKASKQISEMINMFKHRDFSISAIKNINPEDINEEMLLFLILIASAHTININNLTGKSNMKVNKNVPTSLLRTIDITRKTPSKDIKIMEPAVDIPFTFHHMPLLFVPAPIKSQENPIITINNGLFIFWLIRFYNIKKKKSIEEANSFFYSNIARHRNTDMFVIKESEDGTINIHESSFIVPLSEWYRYGETINSMFASIGYRVPLQVACSITGIGVKSFLLGYSNVMSLSPVVNHIMGADYDADKMTIHSKKYWLKVESTVLSKEDNEYLISLSKSKQKYIYVDKVIEYKKEEGSKKTKYEKTTYYIDISALQKDLSSDNRYINFVKRLIDLNIEKGVVGIVNNIPFEVAESENIDNRVVEEAIRVSTIPDPNKNYPVVMGTGKRGIELISLPSNEKIKNSSLYYLPNGGNIKAVNRQIGVLVFLQSLLQNRNYANHMVYQLLSDYISLTVDITKDDTGAKGLHLLLSNTVMEMIEYYSDILNGSSIETAYRKLSNIINMLIDISKNEESDFILAWCKNNGTESKYREVIERANEIATIMNNIDAIENKEDKKKAMEVFIKMLKSNSLLSYKYSMVIGMPFFFKYIKGNIIGTLVKKQSLKSDEYLNYIDINILNNDILNYVVSRYKSIAGYLNKVNSNPSSVSFISSISSKFSNFNVDGYNSIVNMAIDLLKGILPGVKIPDFEVNILNKVALKNDLYTPIDSLYFSSMMFLKQLSNIKKIVIDMIRDTKNIDEKTKLLKEKLANNVFDFILECNTIMNFMISYNKYNNLSVNAIGINSFKHTDKEKDGIVVSFNNVLTLAFQSVYKINSLFKISTLDENIGDSILPIIEGVYMSAFNRMIKDYDFMYGKDSIFESDGSLIRIHIDKDRMYKHKEGKDVFESIADYIVIYRKDKDGNLHKEKTSIIYTADSILNEDNRYYIYLDYKSVLESKNIQLITFINRDMFYNVLLKKIAEIKQYYDNNAHRYQDMKYKVDNIYNNIGVLENDKILYLGLSSLIDTSDSSRVMSEKNVMGVIMRYLLDSYYDNNRITKEEREFMLSHYNNATAKNIKDRFNIGLSGINLNVKSGFSFNKDSDTEAQICANILDKMYQYKDIVSMLVIDFGVLNTLLYGIGYRQKVSHLSNNKKVTAYISSEIRNSVSISNMKSIIDRHSFYRAIPYGNTDGRAPYYPIEKIYNALSTDYFSSLQIADIYSKAYEGLLKYSTTPGNAFWYTTNKEKGITNFLTYKTITNVLPFFLSYKKDIIDDVSSYEDIIKNIIYDYMLSSIKNSNSYSFREDGSYFSGKHVPIIPSIVGAIRMVNKYIQSNVPQEKRKEVLEKAYESIIKDIADNNNKSSTYNSTLTSYSFLYLLLYGFRKYIDGNAEVKEVKDKSIDYIIDKKTIEDIIESIYDLSFSIARSEGKELKSPEGIVKRVKENTYNFLKKVIASSYFNAIPDFEGYEDKALGTNKEKFINLLLYSKNAIKDGKITITDPIEVALNIIKGMFDTDIKNNVETVNVLMSYFIDTLFIIEKGNKYNIKDTIFAQLDNNMRVDIYQTAYSMMLLSGVKHSVTKDKALYYRNVDVYESRESLKSKILEDIKYYVYSNNIAAARNNNTIHLIDNFISVVVGGIKNAIDKGNFTGNINTRVMDVYLRYLENDMGLNTYAMFSVENSMLLIRKFIDAIYNVLDKKIMKRVLNQFTNYVFAKQRTDITNAVSREASNILRNNAIVEEIKDEESGKITGIKYIFPFTDISSLLLYEQSIYVAGGMWGVAFSDIKERGIKHPYMVSNISFEFRKQDENGNTIENISEEELGIINAIKRYNDTYSPIFGSTSATKKQSADIESKNCQ